MLKYSWFAAAIFVVISTILPLARAQAWWIRWFDFPRLQILVLGVLLVAWTLYIGLRMSRMQWFFFSILLLCISYQTYRILPYTPLWQKQVKNANQTGKDGIIKLITANVLMHNRESGKYLQVIADTNADIILSTEVDQWWADQLKPIDASHPYQVKYPLDNTYGMILHSKFPLIKPSVQFLVEPMIPSIHSGIRLPGGDIFYLIGLHPQPPGPTRSPDTTQRDAELIIAGKIAKEVKMPAIILGDLNDVAWSHTTNLFQKISGLLDPRIGRGMFNTYHTDFFFMRFPLDHIFHSPHFKFIDLKRLPHIGSDHFPIYAALSFKPQEQPSQPPPEPKPKEKKEAEEILEKERQDND